MKNIIIYSSILGKEKLEKVNINYNTLDTFNRYIEKVEDKNIKNENFLEILNTSIFVGIPVYKNIQFNKNKEFLAYNCILKEREIKILNSNFDKLPILLKNYLEENIF